MHSPANFTLRALTVATFLFASLGLAACDKNKDEKADGATPVATGEAKAPTQWHFVVKNTTDATITKLQVSVDNSNWADFDIGDGLSAGETGKLVWAPSTNEQPCDQWIRAKFNDGTSSPPSKQDFCKELDTPIEFSAE